MKDKGGLKDTACFKNMPLSSLCTIKTGGYAKHVLVPQSKQAFRSILAYLKESGSCPIILGNGSNVLFTDGVLDRPVLKTEKLTELYETGGTVYAGAGILLPSLARFCAERGLSGAEFLCGIPGTVGGGVVMNAGAFHQTISDNLLSVETDRGIIFRDDCGFGYRKSRFQKEKLCVLGATFRFFKSNGEEIFARMKAYREHRIAAQPCLPSAGSVFYREDGIPAWKTVQELGFSGTRIGGAEISPKHANFIVNVGGASSADVLALIEQVQTRAKNQLNVVLRQEIIYIGENI